MADAFLLRYGTLFVVLVLCFLFNITFYKCELNSGTLLLK